MVSNARSDSGRLRRLLENFQLGVRLQSGQFLSGSLQVLPILKETERSGFDLRR